MRLRSIQIETTNRCNLKCPICWGRDQVRPTGFMSMELFDKVIHEAKNLKYLGAVALHFNGESTHHPQFPEMLRMVGRLGLPGVKYVTNGVNVPDEVLLATVESGVTKVHISDHGQGTKAVETAQKLRALRAKYGKGPKITVSVCWAGEDPAVMNTYYEKWRGVADSMALSGTIKDMRWTHLPHGYREDTFEWCHQPFRFAAVLWDGRVTVCCHDLQGVLAGGDVNKNTLQSTIHEPYFVDLREKLQHQTNPKGHLCTGCQLWSPRYTFGVLSQPLPEDVPCGTET